ncbi:hypothetical protein A5482_002775 [Cyanobacterium sp. IPPAS B-1200]|uniref:hypothetical protein n=1 Tax=Cyanobacterium sp. IPPAS B-1200 TaxID=1562720 RepID=UPI0008526586|nr:hypothetical protein [Cyanobacterium sp. IPPAS B-1200]OEJ78953.1 hypothetical protein A5482_11690 [Cyanobacterium sp. IPPAS B-1200]
MNEQTFTLEVKEGKLIISNEIQDYLNKCSENVQVLLTVKSESNKVAYKWNKWFDQLETSQSLKSPTNIENDYKTSLIDKYKKQGLEL